jgi:beta-galactosidase
MTDQTAAIIEEYVKSGGTIVFGCRTGYKDITGKCPMRPFPGPVANLCGITVEDFTRIGENQKEPSIEWKGQSISHGHLTSGPFNDILKLEASDIRVLGVYGKDAGYYSDKPALTERQVGMGKAIYFGGVFTTSIARSISLHSRLVSPVATYLTVAPDIEVAVREKSDGTKLVFLLNYSDKSQNVNALRPMAELISGQMFNGELMLEPFGVAILKI